MRTIITKILLCLKVMNQFNLRDQFQRGPTIYSILKEVKKLWFQHCGQRRTCKMVMIYTIWGTLVKDGVRDNTGEHAEGYKSL